jgi:Amidohydrolase family
MEGLTRAYLALLTVTFSHVCAVAMAQEKPAAVISPGSVDSAVYITHVTVIDTETGKEATDRTVIISGDRISDVRDSRSVKPAAGAKIVDGTGKYLIPGLWDMHVHTWDYESTYPLYIANGVTGVRDMFGPPDANKFRKELTAKAIIAPHFYLASPIIDGNPPRQPGSIGVNSPNSPEEARKVVEEQKQKGADFIKVYDLLTRDVYFAIMDESGRQQISVAGHVLFTISAWEASAAKQKSIEHLRQVALACSSREEELWPKVAASKSRTDWLQLMTEANRSYSDEKCQRLFTEFKKNGTWVVPTITVGQASSMMNDPHFLSDDRLRYFGSDYRPWLAPKEDPRKARASEDFAMERESVAYKKKVVGAMFGAGVPLLAGTDAGNPYCFPGFSLHDELALMVEYGVSPLGALQAATLNAAVFMGASDKYGSVKQGRIADLVLLYADPLADIHNTTKIAEVFLAGKELDRAALDQMLRNAEAAAGAASVK